MVIYFSSYPSESIDELGGTKGASSTGVKSNKKSFISS
jgi:hypothetical protein